MARVNRQEGFHEFYLFFASCLNNRKMMMLWKNVKYFYTFTAWKVYKYGVISGPYFHVFSPNTGKYGPEITPYLDTFHAVNFVSKYQKILSKACNFYLAFFQTWLVWNSKLNLLPMCVSKSFSLFSLLNVIFETWILTDTIQLVIRVQL